MKFLGAITIEKRDVHAYGHGNKSRSQSQRSKPNLSFADRYSSLNSRIVKK